jgi:hypothetical protein
MAAAQETVNRPGGIRPAFCLILPIIPQWFDMTNRTW